MANNRRFTNDLELIEIAQQLVLSKPQLEILKPEYRGQYAPLSVALETAIKGFAEAKRLVLPNLRIDDNSTIGVFSDYSGESQGTYRTYSFLICAYNRTGEFTERMKDIRAEFSLGEKEIEFKDFRMANMRNALPSYLRALDSLVVGLLFTLVINKNLPTVFGSPTKETLNNITKILTESNLGSRTSTHSEKLLRVVHTIAYLIGLLGHDDQKIFWMTDHDAICANEELHKQTLTLLQQLLPIYSSKRFPLVGGGRPFAKRSVEFLDLLSVADIVAGSLGDYLTKHDLSPENIMVKSGAATVIDWLGHDGIGLKKLVVEMKKSETDTILVAPLKCEPITIPEKVTFVPIRTD